ncbi:hypothetical protein VP01_8197g1, partial [Puccinia sorghi]
LAIYILNLDHYVSGVIEPIDDEIELFDTIKCSSEMEVISKKNYSYYQLHCHSSEFRKLSCQLDKIHITKILILQGPQHVKAFNIENIRKHSETPSANNCQLVTIQRQAAILVKRNN